MIVTNERLSNRDWKMLRAALEVAAISTERQKHGAILYKGGRVLAVGVNTHRNRHPSMEIDHADYTEHAEMAVMRAVHGSVYRHDLTTGAILYIVRRNKQGGYALSKPCSRCSTYLQHYGIKRVIYSDGFMNMEV